jgi:hypothetical protein
MPSCFRDRGAHTPLGDFLGDYHARTSRRI